jgi:hypothetical protein
MIATMLGSGQEKCGMVLNCILWTEGYAMHSMKVIREGRYTIDTSGMSEGSIQLGEWVNRPSGITTATGWLAWFLELFLHEEILFYF